MLSNGEIEAWSLACGGIPVVGLTRDYAPGTIWRNRVQEALGNALLKVCGHGVLPGRLGPAPRG